MRIVLSTTLLWNGDEYHSGDEIELQDELARKYIAAGSAELVAPQVETAALQTTPPKGRRNERNSAARA